MYIVHKWQVYKLQVDELTGFTKNTPLVDLIRDENIRKRDTSQDPDI